MADQKISALTGATTPLAGTEVLPIVQSGATVKVSVDNLTAGKPVSVGSLTNAGNLDFTGTGNRITGDFSGAVANRVMFQTSTINGNTIVHALPNGTGTSSQFSTLNSGTDPANCSITRIRTAATLSYLEAERNGTGTYLPLSVVVGGGERIAVSTTGDVTVNTGNLVIGTSGKGVTDSTAAVSLNFSSTAVTANAPVFSTLFKTANGTTSAANDTATTIYTAPTLNNGTYIVSCNLPANDPTNYSAVSVVTVDVTTLRATALQTAGLLSISVSGQTIKATQLSGSTANIVWTITRVS